MCIFQHFSSYQLLYTYFIPLIFTTFLTRRIPLAVFQEENKLSSFPLCNIFSSPRLVPPIFLRRTHIKFLAPFTQVLETDIYTHSLYSVSKSLLSRRVKAAGT